MDARAPAERAHRLAELLVHEGVHGDGGPAAHPVDREAQVVDRLDARMADLLEVEVGELCLERDHEPRGGLSGGVGDDVKLDRRLRLRVHVLRLTRSAPSEGRRAAPAG